MSTEGVGLVSFTTPTATAGALPAEAEALLVPWRRFNGL
jgi:hypothetical protein